MSEVTPERRYGGRTATERRELRRRQLLDAGLALFGSQGYAATSIEAVCARARLNARYFYEAFESRESLLGAVYDEHVEAVWAAVIAAIDAAPADPAVRLRAGLEAFVEHTLADPRAARINYLEMVGVSPALEARRRGVLRRYADMIAGQLTTMLGADVALPGDVHLLAVALVAATDGLIIDRLAQAGGETPPAADRAAIVATLAGIFAAAVGVR